MLKKTILALAAFAQAAALYSYNMEYFEEDFFDIDYFPIPKAKQYTETHEPDIFKKWFTGPYAAEDFFGARTSLEDMGIVPVLSYIGNFAANPAGGISRGAAVSSSFNMGVGVNLGKLLKTEALSDWSIVNTWVWRFGDSLTDERLGNAFTVQQNYGAPTIRMQSLYLGYNKHFENGWALNFKLGRFAAADDFLTKPIYWLYMSNSIDGSPVGIFKQMRFSAYPAGTWAAYSKITAPDGKYFKAGVYQINSDAQDSPKRHGLDFAFDGALGVNANFELGWDINHDNSGKSPASVSVGYAAAWYDAPVVGDPFRSSTYNSTIYFQADCMIWNMGFPDRSGASVIKRHYKEDMYRDLRGIVAWCALQYAPDKKLAEMPFFVTGGLFFNAPFESRPDDVLCFGATYGSFSDRLGDSRRDSYELMFELNYKYQVNRFFFLQPDMQYIHNIRGGDYSDALVLGLQFGIGF